MDRFVILINGKQPEEVVCDCSIDYERFGDYILDLLDDNPYIGIMNMAFSEYEKQ